MTNFCSRGVCVDYEITENELDDEFLDYDIDLNEWEKVDEDYTEYQNELDEPDDFDYEIWDEDNYEDYNELFPVPEPWEDIDEPIMNDDWSKSFKHNKKNGHVKD